MRFSTAVTLLLSAAQSALCQDGGLSAAIANNTELSTFRQFLLAQSAAFNAILPSASTGGITVLVPTNGAFEKFLQKTGSSLATLSPDRLLATLRYHVLAARVTSANLTAAVQGLAIPTLLQGEQYNNRSAGAGLIAQFGAEAAKGNVVFLTRDRLNPAKLRLRQSASTPASLRGGMAQDAAITPVDGVWALGYYQIIDTILEPPAPCSNTIRSLKATLSGLDQALNRSGLWEALDHSPNVTCLAPSNDAFTAAGSPQTSLNETVLKGALLFHTLPEVTYSNFLQDGLVIKSLEGGDVTVKLVGNDIYFNDAKVISPNVLTNNGLLHVLDKVMSPNGTAPSPSSTTTPTGTSTPSPTQSTKNAGQRLEGGSSAWFGLLAFALAAVLV